MKSPEEAKGLIIQFDERSDALIRELKCANDEMSESVNAQSEQREWQNALMAEIDNLASQMGVNQEVHASADPVFIHLERNFDDFYNQSHTIAKRFPSLSPAEWIYSSVAGIIAVAIDVIFVGTPEVVKIYKGGENFDGSKLTSIIRKIGTDPESKSYAVFHWLSDKCKVSYDLSAVKYIMYPDNHRVRSLGHDPLLGLFFAVADILLGTTTCIDNDGCLRVLIGNHQSTPEEKMMCVFYYIGHIFSDICTSRGIPIPGFFLTQFFIGDGSSNSIAKVAEKMYLDGYDMRHLVSMSVPVIVKNLLINAYLLVSNEDNTAKGIAEREIEEQNRALKKEKMIFVSDVVATGGNLAKVLLPPNCGNPASLNLTQWAQFLKSSMTMVSAVTRDMSVETVFARRRDIDDTWEKLLAEIQT